MEVPQFPFFAGVESLSWFRRRFPWSSCSEDHGNSAVAVFFLVVDAPVVQVVFLACGYMLRQWFGAALVVDNGSGRSWLVARGW